MNQVPARAGRAPPRRYHLHPELTYCDTAIDPLLSQHAHRTAQMALTDLTLTQAQ